MRPVRESSVLPFFLKVLLLVGLSPTQDKRLFVGILFVACVCWIFKSRGVTLDPSYRIADGIKNFPDAAGCELYPNSLVCAYRKRTKLAESIPDLVAVLRERNASSTEYPPNNVVVLHLRLGDGLCAKQDPDCRRWGNQNRDQEPDCWNDDRDCWVHPTYPFTRYAYSKSYYVGIAKALDPSQRIVILSSAGHWTRTKDPRNGSSQVDALYRDNVVSFFQSHGFDVEIRSPRSPDDDFTYACFARTFIQGGGGFSALIAKVARAMGSTVLPPQGLPALQAKCGALCNTTAGTFSPGQHFQQRGVADMNCTAYFDPEAMLLENRRGGPAQTSIPHHLLKDFSLDGSASIASRYFNNATVNQVHWGKSQVDEFVALAAEGRLPGDYGVAVTNALRAVLPKASLLRGGRVLVIGSREQPWIEAVALEAGAEAIVTLGSVAVGITTDHPKIEAILPAEYQRRFLDGSLGVFATVIAFELEHAGLGRYGDELNPWEDVLEIARARCVTAVGGSLVIGVTPGKDEVIFNQGRRYGPERLPYLLTGWAQDYRESSQAGRHVFVFSRPLDAGNLPPH